MKINSEGLKLIKSFEGCRLEAYKCPSGLWTIGYGHTEGVYDRMRITQLQADELLREDLEKFEGYVDKYCGHLNLNENQFSALVSFAYNCGAGNLQILVRNRTVAQIGEYILRYNKVDGKKLKGLVRRREAEQKLFLKCTNMEYKEPKYNIKRNSRGEGVNWVQHQLNKKGYNLTVDGIAGNKTINAVKDFQSKNGLVADGIVGKLTRAKLK